LSGTNGLFATSWYDIYPKSYIFFAASSAYYSRTTKKVFRYTPTSSTKKFFHRLAFFQLFIFFSCLSSLGQTVQLSVTMLTIFFFPYQPRSSNMRN